MQPFRRSKTTCEPCRCHDGLPKLLILDEPTSQLDPISAERFSDIVLRIRREMGTTIIVSEHNTEKFFNFADKILYLENGRQLAFDTPSKFVKNAANHDFLPTSAKLFSSFKLDNCPAFDFFSNGFRTKSLQKKMLLSNSMTIKIT